MCPSMPYTGLHHRKLRVCRARMLRGIEPGGFAPLTTKGTEGYDFNQQVGLRCPLVAWDVTVLNDRRLAWL